MNKNLQRKQERVHDLQSWEVVKRERYQLG